MDQNDQLLIDTNILGTEDTATIIIQDLIITSLISDAVERTVRKGVYNFGGKQALQAAFGRYDAVFTKKILNRLQKVAAKKVQGHLTKRAGALFAKYGAKGALRILGSSAARGAAAAAAGSVAGVTAGAAASAAAGAIGTIASIATFAVSVYGAITDAIDKEGITKLFDKEAIDKIAKEFDTSLRESFKDNPDYLDEEVEFLPEPFVFDISIFPEFGITLADNRWARKYLEYQDEYMASIGIDDEWRERLVPDKLLDEPPDKNKKGNSTILFISSILSVILIFVIIIALVI